jgi:hypothetical protein
MGKNNLPSTGWTRKLFPILLLVLLPPLCGFTDFQVGVKKGVNLATQYGFNRGAYEAELARFFQIGVFASFDFLYGLSLEPGISYSVKGRMDRAAASIDKLMLEGISAPVLLKYTALDSWITSTLYAGAEVAFALSAMSYTGDSVTMTTEALAPGDEFKRFDMGLLAGTEAMLMLGPYVFLIDLRLSLGLLAAQPKGILDGRPRNFVVSLLFGYGLKL